MLNLPLLPFRCGLLSSRVGVVSPLWSPDKVSTSNVKVRKDEAILRTDMALTRLGMNETQTRSRMNKVLMMSSTDEARLENIKTRKMFREVSQEVLCMLPPSLPDWQEPFTPTPTRCPTRLRSNCSS